MTVESKVQRTWAQWLCRSFAASPTPHWCSGRGAPKLPVPEHVKSSVLMALILGQLLPSSALPSSLVTLMMEHKGKGPEKWASGKAQSAGEKATSSVRRIIGDALRVLQERMPDGGKTLPGILPRCLFLIPIKTLCFCASNDCTVVTVCSLCNCTGASLLFNGAPVAELQVLDPIGLWRKNKVKK